MTPHPDGPQLPEVDVLVSDLVATHPFYGAQPLPEPAPAERAPEYADDLPDTPLDAVIFAGLVTP